MGIWIRTQDRIVLVEVVGVGVEEDYRNTEIVGLNKALKREHLRIL